MTTPSPLYTYPETPPPEFTYEGYLDAVTDIVIEALTAIAEISAFWQRQELNRNDWQSYLSLIYDVIDDARDQVSDLARDYYDWERFDKLDIEPEWIVDGEDILLPGETPIRLDNRIPRVGYERLNINKPAYDPNWFEEALEPAREAFSKKEAKDSALVDVLARGQKELEQAARKTTLWAVEDDPRVRGWARVEGNENIGSCGFCAMMISRGPVYSTPDAAGMNIASKATAVELFKQSGGDIPMDLMARWHPNCDCKVVPVFKEADWPGRDHHLEMQDLWYEVTGEHTGWEKFLAFRREFERGRRAIPRRSRRAA